MSPQRGTSRPFERSLVIIHCWEGLRPLRSADGKIYVASIGDIVTVYAKDAKGDATPLQAIVGRKTQLQEPRGIALGSNGNIYVMNGKNGSRIAVYAGNANGNVAPLQAIKGSRTKLNGCTGSGLALR